MPPRPDRNDGPGRRVARRLLPLLTLGMALAPVVTVPLEAAAATMPGTGVGLTLESVAPAVATGTQSATIDITVANEGASSVAPGTVVARLDTTRLGTSAQVTEWFAATTVGNGRTLASAAVPAIPPGGEQTIRLTIPRVVDLGSGPYGAIPVSVTAAGQSRHTVLGFQRTKEYQPLGLATLVALTPDPDPALFGPPGPERTTAWRQALAPGGRLDRLRQIGSLPGVTAALDPTLLATDVARTTDGGDASGAGTPAASGITPPQETPDPTASPSATPEPTTPQAQEEAERAAFATNLIAALAGRDPIVLPGADVDVSQVPRSPDGRLATLLAEGAQAASAIGGVSGIVWPGDPRWSAAAEKRYAPWSPKPVVVTDRATLTWDLDEGDAGRRSRGGVPLIAVDPGLSSALLLAASPDANPAEGQRLVAQSLVLLGESPGLARTAVAAVGRGADLDPTAFARVLDFVSQVPWLSSTPLSTVAEQARRAPASATPAAPVPPTVNAPAPSPVNAAALRTIDALRVDADLAADVRADGVSIAPHWSARLDQLLSTRWRGAQPEHQQALHALSGEIMATKTAVRVAPQTITFLADRGRLQVTVLNDLDVGVRNLHIQLIPDSPRLRIDTPARPISIGARSRASVIVDATALAAGPVRIHAQVLGPRDRPVGPATVLEVAVSPTSQWVYWVLGAIAVVVLALGLWRNRRAHRRAAAHATEGGMP